MSKRTNTVLRTRNGRIEIGGPDQCIAADDNREALMGDVVREAYASSPSVFKI